MEINPIDEIVAGTILVMTTHGDQKEMWKSFLQETIGLMSERKDYWKPEIEFFNAVLDMVREKKPKLQNHQYSQRLAYIKASISQYFDLE